MNLFNSTQDAINYITSQLDKIERLARLSRDDSTTVKDIIAPYAAGICEAILYLCCEEDSDPNGTIPFPKLKDLSRYCRNFGPMNIPYDVANAAKDISRAEKIDIFNPMDDFSEMVIDEIANIFLPWIIENARCIPAREYAEALRNILGHYLEIL